MERGERGGGGGGGGIISAFLLLNLPWFGCYHACPSAGGGSV